MHNAKLDLKTLGEWWTKRGDDRPLLPIEVLTADAVPLLERVFVDHLHAGRIAHVRCVQRNRAPKPWAKPALANAHETKNVVHASSIAGYQFTEDALRAWTAAIDASPALYGFVTEILYVHARDVVHGDEVHGDVTGYEEQALGLTKLFPVLSYPTPTPPQTPPPSRPRPPPSSRLQPRPKLRPHPDPDPRPHHAPNPAPNSAPIPPPTPDPPPPRQHADSSTAGGRPAIFASWLRFSSPFQA